VQRDLCVDDQEVMHELFREIRGWQAPLSKWTSIDSLREEGNAYLAPRVDIPTGAADLRPTLGSADVSKTKATSEFDQ
jgi:hypothetical protein